MARNISFTYHGEDYTLGFTLRTVQQMEQAGFVLDEIVSKPTVRIPELVFGSFIANHKGIKRKMVDDIYSEFRDKDGLLKALTEMYEEARDSLVDEGNLDWMMNE